MTPESRPERWIMQGPPGAETVLNGKPYLYFAGTGYLGLQAHPAVLQASVSATLQYGIHTATSRAGFGSSPPVLEVERRAAALLGTSDACYLVSGYAGNFAITAALSGDVQLVLIDESAHECLRESTRWFEQCTQPPLVFRHRDPHHVAELLAQHAGPKQRAILMTDGIFAASGHMAPLAEYLAILDRYAGAMLLVDDAHALAVLGDAGRGTLELAGVASQHINCLADESPAGTRAFHSATLSKAVGGHGGVVAGSTAFLDQLNRASGWLRGASAPTAGAAGATAKALEIVQGDPGLRRRLGENVAALRGALRLLGLPIDDTPSPIIGFTLASAAAMQRVQQQLLDAGIAVGYTRDYAGAGPAGMLRIAVFATHKPAMIERLVDGLRRIL